VMGNGVVSESLTTIGTYIARAENSLACLPANAYSQALAGLLHYINGKSKLLLNEHAAA